LQGVGVGCSHGWFSPWMRIGRASGANLTRGGKTFRAQGGRRGLRSTARVAGERVGLPALLRQRRAWWARSVATASATYARKPHRPPWVELAVRKSPNSDGDRKATCAAIESSCCAEFSSGSPYADVSDTKMAACETFGAAPGYAYAPTFASRART
jgi:hypothetical protein